MQLHELPFQFFIKLLNWIRFSDVLIWKGRLFQTFDPYTFKLFAPKVTWFHSGVSRFNLYCSLTNLLFSLTLKILFINSGYSLFIVLYISIHKFLNLFTLSDLQSFLFVSRENSDNLVSFTKFLTCPGNKYNNCFFHLYLIYCPRSWHWPRKLCQYLDLRQYFPVPTRKTVIIVLKLTRASISHILIFSRFSYYYIYCFFVCVSVS